MSIHLPSRRSVLAGLASSAVVPWLPAKARAAPRGYPLAVAGVTVRSTSPDLLAGFYERVVGLRVLSRTDVRIAMGFGDRVMLGIERSAYDMPDDRSSAGLYHTAFLLPSRRDLAAWIGRAFLAGTTIDGLSDHGVSEAIYLSDPEGNGVEVYADRPAEEWVWTDGRVEMTTKEIDLEGLVGLVTREEAAEYVTSEATTVGHVHLRVGDVGEARTFYSGVLGLDVVRSRDGAEFLSSGGYHHHVAVNVWESAGAGSRDGRTNGLSRIHLAASSDLDLDGIEARAREAGRPVANWSGGLETVDPWGIAVRIESAPR